MDDPLKQNQGDQKFKCNQLNIEVILVAIYSSTFSKSQIFFQNVYYSGYSDYKRHCALCSDAELRMTWIPKLYKSIENFRNLCIKCSKYNAKLTGFSALLLKEILIER